MAAQKFPRDVRTWVATALAAGWTVERTTRHLAFIPPGRGRRVHVATTPSDWRTRRNERARLRRAGLRVD